MEPTDSRRQSHWAELLALAALVVLLAWSFKRPPTPPIAGGMPLPEIMAEGWLNTQHVPSRDSLLGKTVVIDFWFLDCPPCRAAIPELAQLYRQYHPLGVEFVGLTVDMAADVPRLQEFIDQTKGFDWPVGYGSHPTHEILGVSGYPTLIAFDSTGSAIWSSHTTDGLAATLDRALASE